MAVCVGCGLEESGGEVRVATSGVWSGMGFAGGSTSGAPIYCDSAGKLRTVPEHAAIANALNVGSNVGLTTFGTTPAVTQTIKSNINNPSRHRNAVYMVVYAVKFQFTMMRPPFALYGNVKIDGTDIGDEIAETWGIPGYVTMEPAPDPEDPDVEVMHQYTTETIIHSVLTGSLTPNQTIELAVTPRIDANGGDGRAIFQAFAVAIRALVVTT